MNLPRSLSPASDEKGMGFFFTHFVLSGAELRSGSDVYTPPLPSYALDSHLVSCIQTVGLASLASMTHSPRVMEEARTKYIEAIRSTNQALQSPVESKKDSSLFAEILLTAFETIANRSNEAWATHVEGTIALIKLRGLGQFSTRQGIRLFLQATHALIVKCQWLGRALHHDLFELEAEAAKHFDMHDPVWRFHTVSMSFTNFWAAWKSKRIRNPEAVLAKALDLDRRAESIFANASSAWDYKTFYIDANPNIALSGCYHVYPSFMVAQIWNSMRSMRILLNGMIRSALLKGFSIKPPLFRESEQKAQFEVSTDTLYRLQCDIIASTPQHLGHLSKGNYPSSMECFPTSGNPNSSGHRFLWSHFDSDVMYNLFHRLPPPTIPQLPMTRIFGGYSLLRSIYIAGNTDIASEACRNWAVDNLRTIGHSMGTQQALQLADHLAAKPR